LLRPFSRLIVSLTGVAAIHGLPRRTASRSGRISSAATRQRAASWISTPVARRARPLSPSRRLLAAGAANDPAHRPVRLAAVWIRASTGLLINRLAHNPRSRRMARQARAASRLQASTGRPGEAAAATVCFSAPPLRRHCRRRRISKCTKASSLGAGKARPDPLQSARGKRLPAAAQCVFFF